MRGRWCCRSWISTCDDATETPIWRYISSTFNIADGWQTCFWSTDFRYRLGRCGFLSWTSHRLIGLWISKKLAIPGIHGRGNACGTPSSPTSFSIETRNLADGYESVYFINNKTLSGCPDPQTASENTITAVRKSLYDRCGI